MHPIGSILAVLATSLVSPATAAAPLVALSALDGATVPAEFVLDVDIAGASSAKLVVDGEYVGEDVEPPLQFPLSLTTGAHRARVRADVDGTETASRRSSRSAAPSTRTAQRAPLRRRHCRRRQPRAARQRSSSTRPRRSARPSPRLARVTSSRSSTVSTCSTNASSPARRASTRHRSPCAARGRR